MNRKFAAGLVLGFLIGLGCAVLGIPAPAPPVLAGSLLVVAMTAGYLLADRVLARRASTQSAHCGGPQGR